MTKKLEELQRKQAAQKSVAPVALPESTPEDVDSDLEEAPPLPAPNPKPRTLPAVPAPGKKAKTTCPLTRQEFRDEATPLTVVIDGKTVEAEVKEFSTGSLGWYHNGKVTVEVGGHRVTVQVGMNLTIVGSKELPAE